jgi:starch synthase
MASRFPQNVAVFTTFEEPLAHHIYGGCDMFLMPSQFEPCGLGQLIAMRYGALPVVRHTGGLVDTVPGFSPDLKEGHGFIFHEYSAGALIRAVKSAAAVFREHHTWLQAVQRIMNLDFSWQSSARLYENLYLKLLEKSQRELSIPRVYPVNRP